MIPIVRYGLRKGVFSFLKFFPIICSVFAGFVVIGRQCRGWVVLGYWPPIAMHDVLNWWIGRPISAYRMEMGLLELMGWPESAYGMGRGWAVLDGVIRWLLDTIPLAVWLIVVIPIMDLKTLPFRSSVACAQDNRLRHGVTPL
jgi:hypothetical protein